MPGPLPKSPQTRQRRNKPSTAATLEAPKAAPIALPAGPDWHDLTLTWWNTIWASPMVAEWVDADVPGLILLADLVNRYWHDGDPKLAAEIRMQQREYGLSPFARRSLQWEVKRAQTPALPPTVSPLPQRARDPRLRSVS